MRKAFLAAIASLIAIGLAIGIWKASRGQQPGRRDAPLASARAAAPDFALHDLDGKPLVLSHYRGKVVLLDFWATWCTPCRDEVPHFVELQDKYRAQGLEVIGISMDDEQGPVREFYRELRMNYPVAMGTTQVAEAYGGVLGLPIAFLVDRDGRVAAKYVGPAQMQVVEQQVRTLLQER